MTDVVVDTFRVVRRQDMGGSFREHGELLPEAHLYFAAAHWVHTGGVEEAKDVPEAEFRAAVEKYCPDKAEEIYERVGLVDDVYLEGDGHSPRAEPMLPTHLPAKPTRSLVVPRTKRKPRGKGVGAGAKQHEVTIRATDAAPGTPTPGVKMPPSTEEIDMQPTQGDQNYLGRDAIDPHELNEALTGTRPEDIERHNADAAYEQPVTGDVADGENDVAIAQDPIEEPIGADLETGSVAHNDGSGVDPANMHTDGATAGGVVPSENPAIDDEAVHSGDTVEITKDDTEK